MSLANASADGRAIPKLNLHADAQDLLGGLAASATLDGTIDGRAARGRAKAARAGKGWKVEDVDVNIGRASLKGAVAYDGAANGRLTLNAPDLDDFPPSRCKSSAARSPRKSGSTAHQARKTPRST